MPTSIQVKTAEHDAEDNRMAYLHSEAHIAALEKRIDMLRRAMPFGKPALKIEIARLQVQLEDAKRGR